MSAGLVNNVALVQRDRGGIPARSYQLDQRRSRPSNRAPCKRSKWFSIRCIRRHARLVHANTATEAIPHDASP